MTTGITTTTRNSRTGASLLATARLFLLSLCLAIVTPLAAEDWGLESLMAALSQNQQQELSYVETKHLAALDQALISEGRLASAANGQLEMEVYSPKWAQYIITEDTFTIMREDKAPRDIELDSQPQLAAFAAAFRAVRQGDLTTLQQFYKLDLQGQSESWQLTLTPTDEEMAERITHIQLLGSAGDIQNIITKQQDGDYSDMKLTPNN